MMRLKRVRPAGSYEMEVPSDVREDADERVTSYWRAGSDLLLQVSSARRHRGRQVGAGERLKARLARSPLAQVAYPQLTLPMCPDHAAAAGRDEEGIAWLYCYCVWPDLSVLVTISSKTLCLPGHDNWAIEALQSVRYTPPQTDRRRR